MTLTVASLSSGYGGLEMALSLWIGEGASRALWHAETNPEASRVLKTWWPEVPNLGDFTAPGFWESAERADVHVGGIPCQPFSAAGRRLGASTPRPSPAMPPSSAGPRRNRRRSGRRVAAASPPPSASG